MSSCAAFYGCVAIGVAVAVAAAASAFWLLWQI